MKIAILVYGPDFACSENLTQVFKAWGDVQLISLTPSDWRGYNPGLLATTPEAIKTAQQIMSRVDLIILGDATAVNTLSVVSPDTNWLHWAANKQIMAYFGDSAYFKHSRFYDGLMLDLGARLFLLPNLIPLSEIDAIPLHHPMPVRSATKAERLTIMHAPGRDGKAGQKGTEQIEIVIERLKEDFDFDYERLMGLTITDCLRKKATAHIVIDQVPPNGAVHGLGRTGTEALAAGSMVISKMYAIDVLDGYFTPPPVVDVQNEQALYDTLCEHLTNPQLVKRACVKSRDWAADNIGFDAWLTYVGKYL